MYIYTHTDALYIYIHMHVCMHVFMCVCIVSRTISLQIHYLIISLEIHYLIFNLAECMLHYILGQAAPLLALFGGDWEKERSKFSCTYREYCY